MTEGDNGSSVSGRCPHLLDCWVSYSKCPISDPNQFLIFLGKNGRFEDRPALGLKLRVDSQAKIVILSQHQVE